MDRPTARQEIGDLRIILMSVCPTTARDCFNQSVEGDDRYRAVEYIGKLALTGKELSALYIHSRHHVRLALGFWRFESSWGFSLEYP